MIDYISETFEGTRTASHAGDTFFSYDPEGELPADRWTPFATVVRANNYDSVSDLDRPGAYRINIGLTKAGYLAHFDPAPTQRDEHGVLDTGFDYALRDRLLPHPHYATQHWVCVVDPGQNTTETVRRLLGDAHRFAVRKYVNQQARTSD